VQDVVNVDRAGCRAYFEHRFSAAVMADAYLDVYRDIVVSEHGAMADAGLALNDVTRAAS
jgi:hypothetical protein